MRKKTNELNGIANSANVEIAKDSCLVKIIVAGDLYLPRFMHPSDAGADLRAYIGGEGTKVIYNAEISGNSMTIHPGGRCCIDSGMRMQLPNGFEAQVRPRSGLSLKNGIVAMLGTIDSGYRGTVGIIIINFGEKDFVVNNGDRIAQLIFSKVEQPKFELAMFLDNSDRNGGFGHTGTK